MANVYTYVDETGTIIPNTSDIQTAVENEYKAIFGSDLIVSANTPQGALIVAESLARRAVADNNANLANQINPNLAGGVYLDAIMKLTGQERFPGSPTYIPNVTLAGVPGTVIPAGALAKDTVNDVQFELINSVTLDASGNGTGQFQTLDNAAVSVASGTLTIIVSAVLGWETVTNPTASILGKAEMSDAAARALRYDTLFAQGANMAGAIIAAVTNVPGVTSMGLLENIANTVEVIDGVTMNPHSIYMCIAGTYSLSDVAQAITSRKSGGCDYTNGASATNISEPVTSPYSGQTINVLWDKPDNLEINIIVNGLQGTSTSTNVIADITTAVNDYITSLGVGTDVSAFLIASAILAAVPGVLITNVLIALSPTVPTVSNPISVGVYQTAFVNTLTVNVP